jgi:hypothetical protein
LTTQILYPKCSRMQHFASFWTWKKIPSPTAFSLSRVGMYALAYYMIVPTKYHWNISLKKIAIEICCQKCQECSNTFCVTNFFPLNFKGLSNKKYFKNIYTRILDIMKLLLYLSGNHLPLLMFYKNKMVTTHIEKLNTEIYW